MKSRASKPRRQFSEQFKKMIVTELKKPGITVAALSEAHNLDSGLIYKWKIKEKNESKATGSDFIAVKTVKSQQEKPAKLITIRLGTVAIELAGEHEPAMIAQLVTALGDQHAILCAHVVANPDHVHTQFDQLLGSGEMIVIGNIEQVIG